MVMKLFNLLEKDLNQSLKIVIANMTDPLIREKLKLD